LCESSVWLSHPGGNLEKVADDIWTVKQEGDIVVLRELVGESQRIRARIGEVDSLKHRILLIPDNPE